MSTGRNSIAGKLTRLNMLVSGTALALACLAFIAYDVISYREGVLRGLSTQAQIIGSNSVSALVFNDSQSAYKTLSGLSASSNILSAGIIKPDGMLLAEYLREPSKENLAVPTILPGNIDASEFRGNELIYSQRIVFEGKPTGIVYLRADLRNLNARLKRYASIAASVLLGSLIAALLLSSRFRKSVADPIINLAETARIISQEKNYSLRATPTGDEGEIDVLIGTFNEMVAQIQARDKALQSARDELELRVDERTAQLVEANKELEAFSYSVSHDLRGPLDVIEGISYILLKNHGISLDDTGREYLQRLCITTQRMSELIEDLLNLSRVTRGVIVRERLDLSLLAKTIAAELQKGAPARQVHFVIAENVVAEGDSRLLKLAMQNLFGNAWKYTSHHERACIEFGWGSHNGMPVYFIRDDGAGFDNHQASRLFGPFQRLHSAAEFPGTGVGLATVQRIIRRHGGQIWAEGAVESGATFYFTLAEASAASPRQVG